jgi:hypothetical protein
MIQEYYRQTRKFGCNQPVAEVLSGVIEICHRSKVKCSPKVAQAGMQEALDLTTKSDWLLTVKQIDDSFQFEATFGAEMKTAKLQEFVQWLTDSIRHRGSVVTLEA